MQIPESALTSSYGTATADKSFKEIPISSRDDRKSPTAETVDAKAIRLLMFWVGNSSISTFCETLAA